MCQIGSPFSAQDKHQGQDISKALDHREPISQDPLDFQPPGLWDLGRTPINVSHMSIYLDKYPIRQVANEIFQGFTYGFMLNYQGPRIGVFFQIIYYQLTNSKLNYKTKYAKKLEKEE